MHYVKILGTILRSQINIYSNIVYGTFVSGYWINKEKFQMLIWNLVAEENQYLHVAMGFNIT